FFLAFAENERFSLSVSRGFARYSASQKVSFAFFKSDLISSQPFRSSSDLPVRTLPNVNFDSQSTSFIFLHLHKACATRLPAQHVNPTRRVARVKPPFISS